MNALQKLSALISSCDEEFFLRLDRFSVERKPLFVSFVNPLAVGISTRYSEYLPALERMDFVFSDGILLCKAIKRLSGVNVKRYSFDGNSLAPRVFRLLSSKHARVAFVGGEQGVAENAASKIRDRFGTNVVFTHHGFIDVSDMSDIFRKLEASGADFLLVGMGAPQQELVLARLKDMGWCGVGMTCGGYLDQVVDAGVQYYPRLIEKLNLRAFYRMFKEPRRLVPRYVIGYWPFFKILLRK